MKKLFQIIGLLTLIICGFIYSEKTMLVVREYDDIMIKIKETKKEVKPIEAVIKNNTIIPGLSGLKIDINKSYLKMKEYGKYNENLLVYEKVLPKELLINNKDKYIISGNKSKKEVSLILVANKKNISSIPNNIKVNIFPKDELKDYPKYKDQIKGYYKYNDWLSSAYKANHMNINYCLDKECFKNNLYVIKGDIITSNYLIETKKKLVNGSIIIYQVSNDFIKELNLIINYINSKGYKIVYLEELLKE